MSYFCHYCEKSLVAGTRWTLECECNQCYLSFDKYGNLIAYMLYHLNSDISKGVFWKDRHSSEVHATNIQYKGKRHNFYIDGLKLKFVNGMPCTDQLFEKMLLLKLYS